MVIALCILSATHLFNAALHVEGVTHGHSDQYHTVRPELKCYRKSSSEELRKGMNSLAYIGSLRPIYVLVGAPFDQGIVDACFQYFTGDKRIFLSVIGRAASDREWSEV